MLKKNDIVIVTNSESPWYQWRGVVEDADADTVIVSLSGGLVAQFPAFEVVKYDAASSESGNQ